MAAQISIDRWLDSVAKDLANAMAEPDAKAQLRRALRGVVKTARANAPVRTGEFRRSLAVKLAAKPGIPSVEMGVRSRFRRARATGVQRGRVRAPQALAVEYGNARNPGSQPMTRALTSQQDRLVAEIRDILANSIQGQRPRSVRLDA